MRTKFSFIFPVVHQKSDQNRKNGCSYEHVADLLVSGVTSIGDHTILDNIASHHKFDIETILYNGLDVSALLQAFTSLDKIEAACLNHIQTMFEEEQTVSVIHEAIKMQPYAAKIISLPLKRKIN